MDHPVSKPHSTDESAQKQPWDHGPYRVGKFFEADGPLCAFQATLFLGSQFYGRNPNLSESGDTEKDRDHRESLRGSIIFDAHQQSFGIRFSEERPFTPKTTGALVATMRKQASGCFLSGIYKQDNNYFIPLHKNPSLPPHLWIVLLWASPPEFHIVDETGTSLVRKSQQGTYTKRKKLEIPLPSWLEGHLTAPAGSPPLVDVNLVAMDSLAAETTAAEKISDVGAFHTLPFFSPEQKEARDRVSRRLKTLTKSYKQLQEKNQKDPVSPNEIRWLERLARGLKAHFYLLPALEGRQDSVLALTDEEGSWSVSLEPGRTPGQWLQDAYENIRKAKRRLEMEEVQGHQLQQEIENYQKALSLLRSQTLNAHEVANILKPLRLKPKQRIINSTSKPHEHLPYRIFQIPLGNDAVSGNDPQRSAPRKRGMIYVGKTASDSDLLVKRAKGHDLWLHAVGTTGSHVIIPGAKLAEATRLGRLEDPLLFAAAVLAHYYSKNRDELHLDSSPPPAFNLSGTSGATGSASASYGGEIYFSTRQFIRKKKGMPPGLWLIDKAKTLYVKYSADDLRRILGTLEVR